MHALESTPDLLNNPLQMNTHKSLARRRIGGFTLIELMVAVVVVGILLAVALPSFMDSIRKGRRSEAFTALAAIQQAQERWRSNRAAYTTTLADLGVTSAVTAGGYYTLSIVSASATGYVLTAVGSGSQLNDGQCANLGVEMNGGAIGYASCTGCATSTFTYAASNRCWAR